MTDANPLSVDDVRALILVALPEFAREALLVIGCSGGPDSLALTLRAAEAFPGQVHALIVDHGLRVESASEATQTKAWLTARNVPADILVWEGDKPTSGIQAAAREARYKLLRAGCDRLGSGYLLLAHHLEDQAETFLLALGRKSGLQGLAGMVPVRVENGLSLVRPLLDVRKARLMAALEAMGQDYHRDPSNENDRFDRVRVRQQLEALGRVDLTPELLAGAATRLADARDLIQGLRQELQQQVQPGAGPSCRIVRSALGSLLTNLPGHREVLVPVLAEMITRISGAKPRFEELERVIAWVALGETGSVRTLGRCRISLTTSDLLVEPE
jgi:tRNA(Ile)-lysidine synthase